MINNMYSSYIDINNNLVNNPRTNGARPHGYLHPEHTREMDNLASHAGYFTCAWATAKTLVPSGHVNPQILGVIRIATSLPLREEW
jgi:hypothetical protein